jgi:hypothetical protein
MTKIAIMGSHPLTKMQAPFDDPDWKIWACSPHNFEKERLPRVDEWFENHVPAGDDERQGTLENWLQHPTPKDEPVTVFKTDNGPMVVAPPTRTPEYLQFVRELTEEMPVWMRDRTNHEKALAFPEEELKKRFCPFMFTSSIAYILAKAIAEAPEVIGLWGIMQASENEFRYQRPGIQYFLWEANRADIEVIAPDESKLLELPEENW